MNGDVRRVRGTPGQPVRKPREAVQQTGGAALAHDSNSQAASAKTLVRTKAERPGIWPEALLPVARHETGRTA